MMSTVNWRTLRQSGSEPQLWRERFGRDKAPMMAILRLALTPPRAPRTLRALAPVPALLKALTALKKAINTSSQMGIVFLV